MKFNQRTIQILKNFSGINQSILFKQGDIISTVSASKTILAKAKIDQTIEKEFAIYDLPKFISTLSLFSDPEIELEDKKMRIKEGSKVITYSFTDPSLIITPPNKEINITPDVTLQLTAEKLQEALKAMSVLGLSELAFVGENGKIFLKAINSKDLNSDNFSVEVGETDKSFTIIFSTENLKVLPNNYDIQMTSGGISYWTADNIEYWIMAEANSKFG